MSKYAILHGHFYQPPRENPWTGFIDRQDSAYPFNDWNQRIFHECYKACVQSPVFENGKVLSIINCFEYLSFNIGPTLLEWIEYAAQDNSVLEAFYEGDRLSMIRNNGHGNAIAQVYNHMIMPLASPRDQYTQIKWGLHSFKKYFGRDSEGIWLAETAINYETAEILVDCGIKYVILSPYQARNVTYNGQTIDVMGGKVYSGQAYRLPTKNGDLAVFFYDPFLASEISFGDALYNEYRLGQMFKNAFEYQAERPVKMVHTATDGEVYGHHKKNGNTTLARFIHSNKDGYDDLKITNYGNFLELHPPTEECELYLGDRGEGSSWSCAHGVGRWSYDCSCHTGGDDSWNQKWRSPLREALDLVRDDLQYQIEKHCENKIHNIWDARDEYIHIIYDKTPDALDRFFNKHQKKELNEFKRQEILIYLEALRYSMLMYTSCAWFFNDISGIETIQVLLYMACSIEYGQDILSPTVKTHAMEVLHSAISNVGNQNGATLYQHNLQKYFISTDILMFYFCWQKLMGNSCEQETLASLTANKLFEECEKSRYIIHFSDFLTFSKIIAFTKNIDKDGNFYLVWRELTAMPEKIEENFWELSEVWDQSSILQLPEFLRLRFLSNSLSCAIEKSHSDNNSILVLLTAVQNIDSKLLPEEKQILFLIFSIYIYDVLKISDKTMNLPIENLVQGIQTLKKIVSSHEEFQKSIIPLCNFIQHKTKLALEQEDFILLKKTRILFGTIKGDIDSKYIDKVRGMMYSHYQQIRSYNCSIDSHFEIELNLYMKLLDFII